MSEAAVELLRELVAADDERAAGLDELDELLAGTAAVRERAGRIAALLGSAPAERERLSRERAEAELDLQGCSVALADAEAELAAAEGKRDEERVAAARRFVVRARDARSVAERRVTAARGDERELEARVAAAEREGPEVEREAASLAASLRGRPRLGSEAGAPPAPGLDGVIAWAGDARAALTVARSVLAAERDGIIRQANELGSLVLGEPLVASSATLVARRVERALAP